MFSWWRKKPDPKPALGAAPQKKSFGDSPDLPSDSPDFPAGDDTAFSSDAISKYEKHLERTADLYRTRAEEWKAMAIEIERKLPAHHRLVAQRNKETALQVILNAFKGAGAFVLRLHRLLEPASVNLRHILTDIHADIRRAREHFREKCDELENSARVKSSADQLLIKLDLLRTGVAIWDELIKLEENVLALIKSCIAFQKTGEKGINIALNLGENLFFALILASLGNLEELKQLAGDGINICWEDSYRSYLLNAIDGGKKRVELMEINLEGLLARGEELVKNKAAPNKHRFWTPDQNVRSAADEEPGLTHTDSVPSLV